MVSPTVFFHITIDSKPLGRTCFELFADKFPKTAENSHALSTGQRGFGYKASCFHRIIPGCMCQGGDFTRHKALVKEGMNIAEAMECFGSRNGKTSKKVTIADCGQLC
ncbi:hypothetical protein P7K49_027134 [Saguinus oedipus]|uniref:Peptidyl-prolyl cis-trans isomerase n=1 Tax=Saguinus oedipus TaxID=9490 RepID=A0ABQ9UF69_SAGOE|nr:hypothetical protein P7K49_027134 [Saguinus oedipus]